MVKRDSSENPSSEFESDEPILLTDHVGGSSTSVERATVTRGSRWPLILLAALVTLGLAALLRNPSSGGTSDRLDEAAGEAADASERSQAGAGTAIGSGSTTTSSLPGYGEGFIEPDLEYETTQGFDPDRDDLYLLSVPVGLSAFDPEVVVLGTDTPLERRLGAELWSGVGTLTRLNPGEDRHPMLVTDDALVFASLDGVLVQDDRLAEPVRNLGPGIAVLPGPTSNEVWILGTAERTVRLVDVSSEADSGPITIDDIGRPLASAGDGLVLAPKTTPASDFLFWQPDVDPITFADSAGSAYLGAGGSAVVFGRADSMLVYDIDDPATSIEVPLPVERPWGSSVSPDGSLIALTVITPLTEPNEVFIADLTSGEVVTEIGSALQFQYRWSGPSTLLYMQPDWPSFRLVERDAVAGTDRNLLRFPGLNWWYAVRPEVATS